MATVDDAEQFFETLLLLSLEEQRLTLWSLLKNDAAFSHTVAEHCEQQMHGNIFQPDGAIDPEKLENLKTAFFEIQEMRLEEPESLIIGDEAFHAISMIIDFILTVKKESATPFVHLLGEEVQRLSAEEREMPECIIYMLYNAATRLPAWQAEQKQKREEEVSDYNRVTGQSAAVAQINSRLPKITLKKNKL